MATSLHQERSAQFNQQIDLWIEANRKHQFKPTDEFPGSPAKVEVLRQRLEHAEALEREPNLCCAEDAKLPLGKAWHFSTRKNGRVPITDKILVNEEFSNQQEVLARDAASVFEEIRKVLGGESPCARAS
jgi:hypothetical protein